jgi:hypothetical protein
MNLKEERAAKLRLENAPIIDEFIRTKLRKTGRRYGRVVYGLKQRIPVPDHVSEEELTEALRRHGYIVTRNGTVNAREIDWF